MAYYCNSKFDRNKRIIIVSSGISKENEEALINEIEKQLNDIKSGNITDKEILYAKNHLKNQFYSIRDSKSLIEFFYYNQLFYVEHGSLEECVERIFTVEKKDILKSSEKINLDTVLVQ